MPFCNNCGANIGDNDKFCGSCGTPVVNNSFVPAPGMSAGAVGEAKVTAALGANNSALTGGLSSRFPAQESKMTTALGDDSSALTGGLSSRFPAQESKMTTALGDDSSALTGGLSSRFPAQESKMTAALGSESFSAPASSAAPAPKLTTALKPEGFGAPASSAAPAPKLTTALKPEGFDAPASNAAPAPKLTTALKPEGFGAPASSAADSNMTVALNPGGPAAANAPFGAPKTMGNSEAPFGAAKQSIDGPKPFSPSENMFQEPAAKSAPSVEKALPVFGAGAAAVSSMQGPFSGAPVKHTEKPESPVSLNKEPEKSTREPEDIKPVSRASNNPAPAEPPMYDGMVGTVIKTHLAESVFVTLCCCQLGIVSIVFSALCKQELSKGNYEKAASHAKTARIINIVSLVLGLLGTTFAVVVSLLSDN